VRPAAWTSIDDPDPFFVAKRLDDKLLQLVACCLGSPGNSVQLLLHAIGDAIPDHFGDLPAVLVVGVLVLEKDTIPIETVH
jgi:hypothetical protein